MLKTYLVIERFKDVGAVYRRFAERGRMAPDGVRYVTSVVDEKLERCWQIMEARERALLDEWMRNWEDLVDFEVLEVLTSDAAARKIRPLL
jgi:hypothetical protein